jgi:predicted pyridoxine 5'-phosphate oxidase superfamily flavin-nucleotide-binding protein
MPINMLGEMQAIDSALADGCMCLLGTADADGQPQISPKGSMLVLDATHLAYWERSGRTAAANLKANSKVVVYYRNTTKSERLPRGAVWRFQGTARVIADGPERDNVWAKVVPAEQEKDPTRKGAAVVIEVSRITDLAGKILQDKSAG